jgi:hypothetical protein
MVRKEVKKQTLLKEESGYRFQNLGGGINDIYISLGDFDDRDITITPTLYSTITNIKIKPSESFKNKVISRYKDGNESVNKELSIIKKKTEEEISELIIKELKKADNTIGKEIEKIVAKYNK